MFAKGSTRFHRWLLNTGIYKRYIEQSIVRKAMDRKAKRNMVITLGIVFGIGLICSPWFAKIIILIVAVLHFYFLIFRVRTLKTAGE